MKKNLLKLTVLATSIVLAMSALTGCSNSNDQDTSVEIDINDDEVVEIEVAGDLDGEFAVVDEADCCADGSSDCCPEDGDMDACCGA